MQKSQLNELIFSIPPSRWEESLPIGEFRRLEVLQYITRPFSFIARCRVQGERDARVVFIKRYRNLKNKPPEVYRQKVEKEHQNALYWYQKFAGSPQFRVVKPLLAIPEQFISVTEESRGESLFQLVLKNARYFPSPAALRQLERCLRNTGAWLRYKHSILAEPGETYSPESLMEYMDMRLKILAEDPRRRFDPVLRERVLAFMAQQKTRFTPEDLLVSLSHSDFNPGNILVDGDTVTVLDFGRLVKESYLLDVSKLYFQLQLLTGKPQYRRGVVGQLQRALLEGFGDPGADQRRVFRCLMIRHILTHLNGITRFWKQGFAEKFYNRRVMRKELKMLDDLLTNPMRDNHEKQR